MARGLQVVFDCANPDGLARFWAAALEYTLQPPPEGYTSWEDALQALGIPQSEWDRASAIIDPAGNGPRIYFQKVPEGKQGKNRLHLDINVGEHGMPADERRQHVDSQVQHLQTIGASVLNPGTGEFGEYWVVMQDPEGNEFCVH